MWTTGRMVVGGHLVMRRSHGCGRWSQWGKAQEAAPLNSLAPLQASHIRPLVCVVSVWRACVCMCVALPVSRELSRVIELVEKCPAHCAADAAGRRQAFGQGHGTVEWVLVMLQWDGCSSSAALLSSAHWAATGFCRVRRSRYHAGGTMDPCGNLIIWVCI